MVDVELMLLDYGQWLSMEGPYKESRLLRSESTSLGIFLRVLGDTTTYSV